MKFHLDFKPEPLQVSILHTDGIMLNGSCFAEHIGQKLRDAKFNVMQNPHGILFNPLSIAHSLYDCMACNRYEKKNLVLHHNVWHSMQHHSRYSSPDSDVCLEQINTDIERAHLHLKDARWLIITFGSAYGYRINRSGEWAGNCHKLPQQQFTKVLQHSDDIVKTYNILFERLKAFNPKLNVILSVSPVRYTRDGLAENNLSKAMLIAAVHQLTCNNVHYFPAYELVIDDLRDYRFYDTDMVHPNAQAIDYVWQKFMESTMSFSTRELVHNCSLLSSAMQHRPMQPDTEAHRVFLSRQLDKVYALKNEHPFLDLKAEEQYFSGA